MHDSAPSAAYALDPHQTEGESDMKGKDRFLIAIVVGMVLLVAAVVLVVLNRRGQPAYKPDDSPEAAAYNYLLALRQKDYVRAYSYLSPTLAHYPADADQFAQDIRRDSWAFSGLEGEVSLAVEAVVAGVTQTTVEVRQTTYYEGGLFDSGEYSFVFDLILKVEGEGWRIVEAERYWYGCWSATWEWCD